MSSESSDREHCAGYEILRTVAAGRDSMLYEARCMHSELRDRRVALKILQHPEFAQHFLAAARVSACLDHPQIPALYEVGESEGRPYVARMFVDGHSSRDCHGAVERSATKVATIVASVASALDHAHDRGIVHGDVHPRHVLIGEDESAWLIGFGEFPRAEDMIYGNAMHLAPEQLHFCDGMTPATDVYGLAHTALWLMCGQHPFRGLCTSELFGERGDRKPCPEVEQLLPDASRAVVKVLRRGMATDPEARYSRASDLAAALTSAAQPFWSPRRWWFRR